MNPNLTEEQWTALMHWRSRYGRSWKTKLLEAWGTGNYRYSPHASVLVDLRSVLGLSGLRRLDVDQYARAPKTKRRASRPTA